DEEDVDERQRLGDVERDEVLAALRLGGGRRDAEHVVRLCGGGHQKTPVTNARMSTPTRATASTPAVIASPTMSLLPFSGAGGRMISPVPLMVLTAALAAIGVGEDAGGSSPSISTASTSLPSVVPSAWPREPRPSSGSVPVMSTSPVAAIGDVRAPADGTWDRISAFGAASEPVDDEPRAISSSNEGARGWEVPEASPEPNSGRRMGRSSASSVSSSSTGAGSASVGSTL